MPSTVAKFFLKSSLSTDRQARHCRLHRMGCTGCTQSVKKFTESFAPEQLLQPGRRWRSYFVRKQKAFGQQDNLPVKRSAGPGSLLRSQATALAAAHCYGTMAATVAALLLSIAVLVALATATADTSLRAKVRRTALRIALQFRLCPFSLSLLIFVLYVSTWSTTTLPTMT